MAVITHLYSTRFHQAGLDSIKLEKKVPLWLKLTHQTDRRDHICLLRTYTLGT